MNRHLFEDSDDNLDENHFQIKTNESYAKTYNSLRKKELLVKYKGLDVADSETDDSDTSEEDETLDPAFDKEFLKTLASLKSKDPIIYDKNIKFFENKESDENSTDENSKCNASKGKKSKPVTLKDYERKIILEKGGKFVDDSDEEDETQPDQRPPSPTLVEEELRLKAEFKKVMNQDDASDEEFGGIFKRRQKTNAEKDKEEEDYLKWLAGKNESIGDDDVKKKLEPLKNYWSNDKLPSSEKFLRDYVLNKGYSDAVNYDEIPTYEEIVEDQAPLSEDEQDLEKQAEFEQKYNFRFEEPDKEFIKRYPRTIDTSLRITDEKRKKKRQDNKQRKLQEKEQKLKELELVKEIKRKEIQEKIEKLKAVTGNDELGFKDGDLEDDFDPEAHDRRMQELFNDDYYQMVEGDEKPECPSDIEELKVEDWDNYDPQQNDNSYDYYNAPHCEDEDFNMDCDYDPVKATEELQKKLIENTKKRRGGRKGRRDRFMEVIKAEKPVFDPEDEKTYGEYIDEYYKLDCEDIIDDIPCRFKYVETTPNDFGLSIEEILLAKNKELNQWASLKKAIQIRPEHVEKKERRLFKLKAKNEELKRKIFKSLYGSENELEDGEEDQRKVANQSCQIKDTHVENINENSEKEESKKSKKRKKRKAKTAQASLHTTFDQEQNLSAKKIKMDELTENNVSFNGNTNTETKANLGKKKKKNVIKTENMDDITLSKNVSSKINLPKEANDEKQIYHTVKNAQKLSNFPSDSKLMIKNNPFTKTPSTYNNSTNESIASLPPLRKQHKLNKTNAKLNSKYKSKNQKKKPFNGKSKTKSNNQNISDERLKAYGINPKKFHKKKKYGNAEQ